MPPIARYLSQARSLVRTKQGADILWNLGSMGVLTVCGFALLALILRWWDDGGATLGIFEQVYAGYIFFSQLAVGGLDRSALRAVAAHPTRDGAMAQAVIAALLPTFALALCASVLFFLARNQVAAWLESPGVALGIAAATPGLFCFAINKVLLAVLNGLERMRAFAVFQSLRYVLILVGLLCVRSWGWDGARVAFVFTFSESILLVLLAVALVRALPRPRRGSLLARAAEHARFGLKSMASGVLLELQARVDVWMIGLFLSDARVGIYGFAARVAEGVFQILVVLQNVYNPKLAAFFARGEKTELERFVRGERKKLVLGMAGAAALAIAVYPVCLALLAPQPAYRESWLPYAVLVLGMAAMAGYYPFSQTLLMAGFPGWHSLYMLSIVALNVVFNALLIQALDIPGAALATAGSFVCSCFLLVVLVRRRAGLQL